MKGESSSFIRQHLTRTNGDEASSFGGLKHCTSSFVWLSVDNCTVYSLSIGVRSVCKVALEATLYVDREWQALRTGTIGTSKPFFLWEANVWRDA